MAGIDATIPLSAKVPDSMTTLGNVMNVARGVQELQTGRIQQQRLGVQLTQEQGSLQARQAIMKVMADPSIRDPETGLVDLNKLAPMAQEADPNNYLWHEVVKKTAEANSDLMKVKSIGMTLGDQAQAYIGQRMGALALDPSTTKEDVNKALDDAVRLAPGAAPMAAIVRKTIDGIDAGHIGPVLTKFRNFAFPVAAQAPQTALVGTGATTAPVQTNPLGGPVGPTPGAAPIPNTIGPAQAQQPSTDVLGNPVVLARDAQGRITPQPMPGARTPPLMQFPPGESPQTAQALGAIRTEVNQAASKVPEQHFNNQQIVRLADEGITGTNANTWAKWFSSIGLQWLPGEKAANYQQLGHFMSLQAQANAKAMGAGTDAARSVSEQATGSAGWDPAAIKRATKINDALSTGVDLFNRGLEAAINRPDNQKSIFAARDFQNAWSKTFDVNAMRLHNAIQAGDTTERNAIIQSVGGKNSAGAKALADKMRALDALIGGP